MFHITMQSISLAACAGMAIPSPKMAAVAMRSFFIRPFPFNRGRVGADGCKRLRGHPSGSADERALLQRRKNMNAPISRRAIAATGKFGELSPVITAATMPQAITTTAIKATAMTAS